MFFFFFNLKYVWSVDKAHEGQKASVRPAMDGNAAQVHKLILVSYVVQSLHLVFNFHLTLDGKQQALLTIANEIF